MSSDEPIFEHEYAELLKKKKDLTIQLLDLQKELTEVNYQISEWNRKRVKIE